MILRLPIGWAVLLCTAIPTTVHAQESTYVETRAEESVSDDSRSPTATGTRLEIEAPYAEGRDLSERLADVPGVHPRRTSFGQTAYVTIRGSSTRQVHVEWEGLRLNPPFGPGYDLGGTSLLGFDELIVWRGPTATYRGSGAVAGALEFRTRHLQGAGRRIVGSALGGSFGTAAASADVSVATDDVSTRLAVAGRRSDGGFEFEDAQGVTARRVNNEHQRSSVFASSEVRAGETTWRGTALVDGGSRGTPGQSEFQDQFAAAELTDRHTLALLRGERPNMATAGKWSVDGFGVVGVQHRDVRYENPDPFLGGEPIVDESNGTMVGTKLGATAWGPRTVVRAEASGRRETWTSARVDATRLTGGVGAGWEQSFFDRRLLSFVSGRVEASDAGNEAILPAVGARLMLGEDFALRANLGRTHRNPDLDELYLDTETLRGNPDLEAERAWVGDLSIGFKSDIVSARAAVFGQLVDSAILFLPVSAYLVEANNIEGTRSVGGELSGAVNIGRFGGRAAYTYTNAAFIQTGDPVPLQPAHRGTARLDVETVPGEESPVRVVDSVVLWTRGDVRGPVYLDPFGNQTARGYLFWDLGVTIADPGWEFTASVRNLLDDNGAVDALQQPLPGRSIWATVLINLEGK